MPVLILLTAFLPQTGQTCFCFILASTAATLLLILRPYLGPNLPAEPTLTVLPMSITPKLSILEDWKVFPGTFYKPLHNYGHRAFSFLINLALKLLYSL
ncbi:hypothetical protein BD01_0244 [Thermococcus nautili]|uniref:Uncharacterized protein n=1 Tax=Thermococcus nautili TaxID=195522 RepID=W8NZJ0_9EURY|nr:hypothetical protein BD01_0244 [Thermococcus nautili]